MLIFPIVSAKLLYFTVILLLNFFIQDFKQIVKVFDNCKTSNRINFLNYYYIIYKLLESMNQVDILKHVPRLKSKHRILEHDKIWRRICTQLEWEFIKTRAPSQQIGY